MGKRAEQRKSGKPGKTPKTAANDAKVVALPPPAPWMTKISALALSRTRRKAGQEPGAIPVVFRPPQAPPGVIPKGCDMANDQALSEVNAWAGAQAAEGAWYGGQAWLGYTYLSELAQKPEYRRISEVLATEATRKGIKLTSTATDADSKAERITQLAAEMVRLDVQGAFRKLVELDGFFGRSHLYLDTGDTDDPEELITPIGDGCDEVSANKFAGRTGFLKALRPVEPVWVYPARYNSMNPLTPDWYTPTNWYVQGVEVHGSRLLTFVGREVPDLLKPTYAFGGLSLSQMAKPYVDNWLRTRQAVADLVWSFSVRGLKTNLAALMAQDGDQLLNRAALFANMQNNQGLMLLDKDTEDFFNISTNLGSLNDLQAQAQEHMASVTGTPIVKLLGIQPAGLNASSQGELTVWYDWVEAFQEKFIRSPLTSIIHFIELSLWGETDPEIVFTFESLRALSGLEESTVKKQDADAAVELIGAGVLAPEEVRRRLAADPDSGFDGLDVEEAPPAPPAGLGRGEGEPLRINNQ
jgi:uncharacterized protein